MLYPYNWIGAHELVRARPVGEAVAELAKLAQSSWSIHLFGKMTNHLRIQPGSIAAEVFAAFNLGVPRKTGLLSSGDTELARPSPDWKSGPQLRVPRNYTYRTRTDLETIETAHVDLLGSLNGRFDGLDLIYVRGVPQASENSAATIRLATSRGGRVVLSAGSGSSGVWARTDRGEADPAGGESVEVELGAQQANLRAINSILRGVTYVPPAAPHSAEFDLLRTEVLWAGAQLQGKTFVSLTAA